MQIKGIHHIAISVENLEQSVKFYMDLLGFIEIRRFERNDLNGKAAFLKLGDVQLEIWEFKDNIESKDDLSNLKIKGLRHIALSVDNFDKICTILKSKTGASEPRFGASGKRYCFIKDPNGIPIELYEDGLE